MRAGNWATERSRAQLSSMARNILNHAARASADGERDLAGYA